MRLLAIDPGSIRCGIAIFHNGFLERTGTVCTDGATPLARRLSIACQLVPLIAQADVVVSEEPFLQGKAKEGMQRLLGMIEKMTDGQVKFVHPMTVKSKIGHGTLDKLEVAIAAGQRLQTDREQDIMADAITREAFDETDSVAIGLVYLENLNGNV